MKLRISAGETVLTAGISMPVFYSLGALADWRYRSEVTILAPAFVGLPRSVVERRRALEAVERLISVIGGDQPQSCELEFVFPGQRPFLVGGMDGIKVGGKRINCSCIGPVCKVIETDAASAVFVRELVNMCPGDDLECDDGTKVRVRLRRGRSPCSKWLARVRGLLESTQADVIETVVT